MSEGKPSQDNGERKVVWTTKYALTNGIEVKRVVVFSTGYAYEDTRGGLRIQYKPSDFHTSLSAATKRVAAMIAAKIKSVDKARANLLRQQALVAEGKFLVRPLEETK